MMSFGMLRRVVLVKTDVSEEFSASIIRVTRIGEIETLAVTSNRHKLRRNTKACYGDRFTFFYVDDDSTSQETHVRASTAFYGDSFTFYM
jgi:hypothetical protein